MTLPLLIIDLVLANDNITQIMREVKKKTSLINSYQVDYELKVMKEGRVVNSIGHMEFDEPDKFYIKVEILELEGEKQMLISDGHTMWEYLPDIEVATKLRLDELKSKEKESAEEYVDQRQDIRKPFSSMKNESLKFIKKITENNKDIYIIEGEPQDDVRQEAAVDIIRGKIWIDATTGLPKKVIWYDTNGTPAINQVFKNARINVKIDEDIFKFTPPEGVYVMDITEESD